MIAILQQLFTQFEVHPAVYSYTILTAVGTMLNSVAPNSRITKAIIAVSGNLPKIWNLFVSLSTNKTLAAALVLAGKIDAPTQPTLVVTQPVVPQSVAVVTPKTPVVEPAAVQVAPASVTPVEPPSVPVAVTQVPVVVENATA